MTTTTRRTFPMAAGSLASVRRFVEPTSEDDSGRGLPIVARLADR